MNLSIVIPAYNEEKRIKQSLERIVEYVTSRRILSEIIVVDDGSSDNTCDVVMECLKRYSGESKLLKNGVNRGKGFSVRKGMLQAEGDFVLFTDADLSTPIEEVQKLLEPLQNGFQIAIGSRGLPESRVEVHQSLLRELMGKCFNKLARALTFKGVHDSQCGFKCFTKQAAKKIFGSQKMDGFSFDVEVVYLAQKMKLELKEVPVVWRNSEATKVRILLDPLKMFFDIFRIRIMHLKNE